jgi:hypothetical protein
MTPEAQRLLELKKLLADLRWQFRSGDIGAVEFARRFRRISTEETELRSRLPFLTPSIVVPEAGH